MKTDWAYAGRWEHLYGSLTYRGRPMYGFGTTSYGAPLDNWGNLIYLDSFNSAYGKGWKRVDSFVSHNPTGIFCYVLGTRGNRPAGNGERYRATAVGPGVLPDVLWTGESPGPYDRARDLEANEEQRRSYSDKLCRPTAAAPGNAPPPVTGASADNGLSAVRLAVLAALGCAAVAGVWFVARRWRRRPGGA
ncbi:MAG: hypothetical protein ABR521_12370 [Gaiellaceae bacterium]